MIRARTLVGLAAVAMVVVACSRFAAAAPSVEAKDETLMLKGGEASVVSARPTHAAVMLRVVCRGVCAWAAAHVSL